MRFVERVGWAISDSEDAERIRAPRAREHARDPGAGRPPGTQVAGHLRDRATGVRA
jgi:hypothetical protein